MKKQKQEEGLGGVNDPINPPHYKRGEIEVIDFIEDQGLGFNLGNAVKYISRAGHKGDRQEDLKKACWYLNREVDNKLASEGGRSVCCNAPKITSQGGTTRYYVCSKCLEPW